MFLFFRMMAYAAFSALGAQGLEFLTFNEETGQVDITFNIESLPTIAVGAVGFVVTHISSYWDKLRGPAALFASDQAGRMSMCMAIGSSLLLMTLAACDGFLESDQGLERTAEATACLAKISADGIPIGTREYRIRAALCGLSAANQVAIDRLILDDDRLGRGGKL